MPRVAPAQHSHSAAEISPPLYGRPDFARYQIGLERVRGFLPIAEGPAIRMPGTRFVGNTHNDTEARLIGVQLYDFDGYVLEWSDQVVRFWRQEALIGGGSPLALATVYETADLPSIQYEPSADRLYLVDGAHHPQRMTRSAVDTWAIEDTPFELGPFRPQNTDPAKEIKASATTGGPITLTSTFDIFTSDHIGAFFLLAEADRDVHAEWQANDTMNTGVYARHEGNTYKIVGWGPGGASGSPVGNVPPTHTEGDQMIGYSHPVWRFIHDGTGVVRITAVTDAQTATATIETGELPGNVAAGTGTYRWREGAWSDAAGYPAAIGNADQRMIYGGTPSDPLGVWFSAVGRFLRFKPSVLADESFAYQLSPPRKQLTSIRWIAVSSNRIHFGARSGEIIAKPTDDAAGYTLGTTRFYSETTKGTSEVQAVIIDGVPVFLGPDGLRLYGLVYQFEDDRVSADPLTLAARHILKGRVKWAAWQEVPMRVLWLGLHTGELVSLTYEPDQGVIGFARHPWPGEIEWGTVKTTDDELSQELWLSVKRTINGQTRRHVEILVEPFGLDDPVDDPPPLEDAWHLYAAVRYQGAATTTITGLGHLEGEEVWSWTDKGAQGPYTVQSGQIELDQAATSAITGLDISDRQTMRYLPIQPGAADGGSDGQARVSRGAGPRLLRTAGGTIRTVERSEYGDERVSEAFPLLRQFERGMDGPFLYSGPTDLDPQIGWTDQLQYEIQPVPGAPITVQSLTPRLLVAEN